MVEKPLRKRTEHSRIAHTRRHLKNGKVVSQEAWNKDLPPSTSIAQTAHNSLTVTSTDQNRKLQSVRDVQLAHAREQTSKEWLSQHGLLHEGLTVQDLFGKGVPLSGAKFHDGEAESISIKHLRMEEDDVHEFEAKIHTFIHELEMRIQWLLSESRKVFGLVKGFNPCVMIDSSNMNMCYGRSDFLRDGLQKLLEEQLSRKSKIQLLSFNQTTSCAWNQPKPVNNLTQAEIMQWIERLTPCNGCNVLRAFKTCFQYKSIDCIVLVLGTSPDQNPQVIIDYVKEHMTGGKIHLHVVNFNCNLFETQQFLVELAKECDGRYHCFSTENQDLAMESTDITLLSEEMAKAYEELTKLNELKEGGVVHNTMITFKMPNREIVGSHFYEIESEEMKRFRKEYQQISVESTCAQIRSSAQWLKTHGLKAKGLSLYQVMAPNAYSYVDSYVTSLNKQVTSRIHHQSMVQMDWYDGSVKNVHVDPVILFSYQNHLQTALRAYQLRAQWLDDSSRRYFGTLAHQRVMLLVDLCTEAQFGLGELQLAMKCLMEQQLSSKQSFNIICIGDEVRVFNESMVKPTKENIAIAWRWFSELTCSGTRKCLEGFRHVFEKTQCNDDCFDIYDMDGICFITTGVPDEPMDVVNAYLCEKLCATDVSVDCVFFQAVTSRQQFEIGMTTCCESPEQTSEYLRTIAHQNNGRFHWIDSQVIVESDDIRLIQQEMNKANNYLQKSQLLFSKLRAKKNQQTQNKVQPLHTKKSYRAIARPTSGRTREIVVSPKHTSLSRARQERTRPKSATVHTTLPQKKKVVSVKVRKSDPVLPWRPSTAYAKTVIPSTLNPVPGKEFTSVCSTREKDEATKQTFYTDDGNVIGSVFRSIPTKKPSSRSSKSLKEIKISSVDSKTSNSHLLITNDWLRVFGLTNINAAILSSFNKEARLFKTKSLKLIQNVSMKELKACEVRVEKIMKRCTKRMKWLLQGSRRVFGNIIEDHVILLIDTSGSMVYHLSHLKEHLVNVVWEQLFEHKKSFNFIQFSSELNCWKKEMVEATQSNCDEAVQWIHALTCEGGTATLDGLKKAFDFEEVTGIYLLSDGKPDCSTTMVLREAANLNTNRDLPVHTISFNCDVSEANTFLRMLAHQSNARFHKHNSNSDHVSSDVEHEDEHTQHYTVSRSTPTSFEGDDLKLLIKEIHRAQNILQNLRSYILHVDQQIANSQQIANNRKKHDQNNEASPK